MKKIVSFLMIFFLVFIFVGCGDEKDPTSDDREDTIKVTSIEVSGIVDGQEMEIGDVLELEIKVLPENATSKNFRVTIVDSNVLKVEDNKKITALKAGETIVSVTPLGNISLKKEYKVKVNGDVTEEKVAPESLTLTGKDEVELNKTTALSVTPTPSNASREVVWSSSDEKVATVNNGIIKGISLGETKIIATSTLNDKISTEFKITVVEPKVAEVILPTSISVDGENEVEVGYSIRLVASIQPAGADPNLVWESKNSDVATIDDKGVVTGIASGSTTINVSSAVAPNVKARFKIRVKVDQSTLYPVVELQGYTIEIMNAASALNEIDPFMDDYNADDKMYKQKAWREVEEKYACKIKVIGYPDDASWGPTRINWINSQAELGQAQADFFVVDASWIPDFYESGALHATTKYFGKYGKNQMEPAIKQCSTYRGELYSISTGVSPTKRYADQGLYYNYGLIQKYKLESPAKLFNEGKWSYEEFLDWCLAAQAVLDDEMWVLSGAPEKYWHNMVQASGVKIADVSTLELNALHKYSLDAVDILRQLVLGGAFDIEGMGYDASVESFQSGNAIFQSASYWYVKTSNRFPTDLWGEDTRYGYVPYPYHSNVGKENSRVNVADNSVMIMAGARDSVHPANVSYENIYRALQEMYLKTIEYQESDETFDADKIKETNISAKLDDPESVEAVMFYTGDKTIFDPIYAGIETDYSSSLSKALRNAVVNGGDFTTGVNAIYNEIFNNMIANYG